MKRKRQLKNGLLVIITMIMALLLGMAAAEIMIYQFKEFVVFMIALVWIAAFGAGNAG